MTFHRTREKLAGKKCTLKKNWKQLLFYSLKAGEKRIPDN